MRYQGWANAETWCVALTMDNCQEFQNKMLSLAKNQAPVKDFLDYCERKKSYIVNMARWVWPHGYNPLKVNWSEIRKHYEVKNEELS